MMRLRKSERCKRIDRLKVVGFVSGMVDKTDALSLVHRDHWWHVSTQRNGYRLGCFRTQKPARIYMAYMLDNASEILSRMPEDPNDNIKMSEITMQLRDIHFAALDVAK